MSIRTAKLDLRVTPEGKEKLQAAASVSRRSVSEFVLESALVRAEETLTDRSRFGLDASQWKAFLAAFDAPPRDLPWLLKDAMRRTLQAADMAGIRAFAVHAMDETARRFYEHFGFIPSPTDPLHLFRLIKDVRRVAGLCLLSWCWGCDADGPYGGSRSYRAPT
jgi:uncharacterized protein (DUF1778 family)